jgi:hypothetical protein
VLRAMSAMPPIATELMHRGEMTRCAMRRPEQMQQNPLLDHVLGEYE